jgi:hypothetical protein
MLATGNVVVGPLCRRPPPEARERRPYFMVATCDALKEFRCDQIFGDAAGPPSGSDDVGDDQADRDRGLCLRA